MDRRFRPLEYQLSFSLPDRLTEVTSWHEHIPFAMALVSVLRPRVLVELGTHRGDSYSALCQEVYALGLSTCCYAVDTWKGDEHAGTYGDEVYDELRAYHDPRYGRFSTLVRSTFDEALAGFPDGAIDLLHLDGLHTTEAVRHDFESWRPKLSPRAVVILHDTNVRERGFGVWRFWREESSRHPSFEFAHGHGLGVLAVGAEAPAEILDLCALGGDERRAIARLYEALGERVAQSRAVRALTAERAEANEQHAGRVAALEEALARAEVRVRRLEEDAAHLHAAAARRIRSAGAGRGLSRAWRGVAGSLDARGARRARELRLLRRSGLFDAAWYASMSPDVAAAGMDPLAHFYDFGAAEGRDPNAWFDTSYYVENDPDVRESGLNPLVHYLVRGAHELRDPHPEFQTARYLAEHPDADRDGLTPLAHFLRGGASARAPVAGDAEAGASAPPPRARGRPP